MFTRLSLINWDPLADSASRADVVRRLEALSPTGGTMLADDVPPNRNGGDLLWRVNFADRSAHDGFRRGSRREPDERLLADHPSISQVQEVTYQSIAQADLSPETRGGIYRVLLVAVRPDTPAEAIARFEHEMMAMPRYVSTILRWNFARVLGVRAARRFTHVWEQEFVDLSGFRGEYMDHPYHWAHLDRWFDPDNPARIIDTHMCNNVCHIERPALLPVNDGARS